MPILESQIEDEVVKWARRMGFLTPKVKFMEDGWPDRLFISPHGHTIFIEFKRPGEKPTRLQMYRILELTKRGIPAFTSDNVTYAIGILKEALEPSSVPGTCYPDAAQPSSGRIIPGPGIRKDLNSPSYLQDSEAEEASEQDAYRSAPPPDVQSVAGRDKEVGGFSGPEVCYPSRGREEP